MSLHRAPLVLIVAVLLIGAVAATCNGDDDNGVPIGSGIEGTVTIGPMCPVIQQDTPCPDQPFQAAVIIQDQSGDEAARFESAEDGTFSIELKPGGYTVVPQQPNSGAPPIASEIAIDVVAGEYTHVDIQYDSGIR